MVMRKIKIDFVGTSRQGWAGGALLVAAVIVSAMLALDYVRVIRTLDMTEAAIEKLQTVNSRASRGVSALDADPDTRRALLKLAQERIERLNIPWDRLFRKIEDMRHDDIALLSIEPDVASGTIRIGAEARDVPAMLAFISEIRDAGVISDAVVTNHQILTQMQYRPVRFSFTGSWMDKP